MFLSFFVFLFKVQCFVIVSTVELHHMLVDLKLVESGFVLRMLDHLQFRNWRHLTGSIKFKIVEIQIFFWDLRLIFISGYHAE